MVKHNKKSKRAKKYSSDHSNYEEDQDESNTYNSEYNPHNNQNFSTTEQETFHFFWQQGSPFSQWHSSTYTLDGVTYANAEQGMMHGKALLFQDDKAAESILLARGPGQMKALGRSVRGFKESAWKKHRLELVYRNNVAKFTQNPHLKTALLSTTGMLVEASPSDAIWGIGLHEGKAKKMDPSRWPGLNLLGKTLTKVRQDIQMQENEDHDQLDKTSLDQTCEE